MKGEKNTIFSRVYLVYGMICLFAIIIIGQAVNLQLIQGVISQDQESIYNHEHLLLTS